MSNFKNLFETLLNQQNEFSPENDLDLNDNVNYENPFFQKHLNKDDNEMLDPQKIVTEKPKPMKFSKVDIPKKQSNFEQINPTTRRKPLKTNNQNNFNLNRRSIIYNNNEYILTNNIVMSVNDLLEKDHVLIKPVIKLNPADLIQSLFKNDTKNITIKELCTDLYYIKYYEKEYIFNYVNEKTIENGFKDYYKYATFKKITSESIEDLISLLHVYGCVEAQPFYLFELNFKLLTEENAYVYLVNNDTFKFISNYSSKEIQKKIIKEFIRKDPEYLLESLLNGQFLKLIITNGTNRITI